MESGRPAWEEEERASSEKKRWLLKRLDALCRAFEGQRGNYERIELLVGRVERLRGKNRRWPSRGRPFGPRSSTTASAKATTPPTRSRSYSSSSSPSAPSFLS